MEIFILVGLILLNGIFAMSEIAIVTARKSRLTALAQKGKSSAAIALKLAEDPTQFLSTVQIGITSIGILNGIFGEAVLAGPFSMWLQSYGFSEGFSSIFATVLVVVVVTYVSIVVGELVPKRIGQISAETIACIMAKPMLLLAMLFITMAIQSVVSLPVLAAMVQTEIVESQLGQSYLLSIFPTPSSNLKITKMVLV